MARGEQVRVPLPQRYLGLVGDAQHHVPAGPRAPGLDEAEVPGADPGLVGELELAAAPTVAPLPDQRPDRLAKGWGGVEDGAAHGSQSVRRGSCSPLPARSSTR